MIAELQVWLQAFFLTLPRLFGMTAFLPIYTNQIMPAMLRSAVLMGVALVPLPLIHAQLTTASAPPFLFLVLKEVAVGLLLGFALSLPFRVPALIGDFLDNQRGASIAQIFDPAQGGQASPLGIFFGQVHVTWFVLTGGLLLLYEFAYTSYAILPVTQNLPNLVALGVDQFMSLLGSLLGTLVKLALLLAAPAILVMLMTEISLGLMGRFAPQLNTFFLAMPLKSLAALGVLTLYISALMAPMTTEAFIFAPARALLEYFGQ